MHTTSKTLIALALIIALCSAPVSAQILELPGLNGKAQIVRDAEGIAHIRAKNDEDL